MRPEASLLDAGCGTGGLLMRVAGSLPYSAAVMALELDPVAAATARAKSGAAIAVGFDRRAAFRPHLRSMRSSASTCYAIAESSRQRRSRAIAACLRPGGVLVLNLPAYRWLFSGHDRAVDNVRRFGRGEVRTLLAASGYAGIRACYWNSLLFPLMVLRRVIHREARSDVMRLPGLIERTFRAVILLECWLGERGLRFPFGGSILATAVKP